MSTPMYEDLERQLKKLYREVPPPPAGLATGRERMLAEAACLKARAVRRPLYATEPEERTRPERRRKMSVLLAYKVMAVVMAIAIAMTGAGGGVVLAGDSLPGDLLYPVKLISEDVKLLLSTDPADRAELAMTYAGERVQEMEKLANQGEVIPDTVLARVTRQMEQTMVEIAHARPEDVPALLERVMERTRSHLRVLDQAGTGAGEENQTRLRQASQVMECAQQAASTGLSDPDRYREQYQHRHEGMLGPDDELSPPMQAPMPAMMGTATNDPERYQEEHQHEYEGAPGPHGELSPSPSPMNEAERSREEHQQRYEGTPGPHNELSPTATHTLTSTMTPSRMNDADRSQREHPDHNEDTPDPQGESSPAPPDDPMPTHTPKHDGHGSGH